MEHKNKGLWRVFFETFFEKMMRSSSSGFFKLSRPQFNTLHQSQRDDMFFSSDLLEQALLLFSCLENSTGKRPKSANLCATHTYQFFYYQFVLSEDLLYLWCMCTYTKKCVKFHKKHRFKTLNYTVYGLLYHIFIYCTYKMVWWLKNQFIDSIGKYKTEEWNEKL